MTSQAARYDRIGESYAQTRREDPRLAAAIHAALGDARTVVNVGAGAGSYEPHDRHVVAIEPSDVMAAQRPRDLAPALRATAGALPLRDLAVDAAMAILTVHHWDEAQKRGVCELRRVARGPVVIMTIDPEVSGAMWLMAEYLPEVAKLDRRIFPALDQLVAWLGGSTRVEIVPVARDTVDWTLLSFWAHPERVLSEAARAATSGFARMPPSVVARVVREVARDLADGTVGCPPRAPSRPRWLRCGPPVGRKYSQLTSTKASPRHAHRIRTEACGRVPRRLEQPGHATRACLLHA